MGFSADRGSSNNLLRLFALICFQKMSQRYNYNSIYLLLFASVVNQNKKIKIAKKKYPKFKYPKYSVYAYSCENVRNQRFPHNLLPTFNEH